MTEEREMYEELMQSGAAGIAAATAIESGRKRRWLNDNKNLLNVEGSGDVMRKQQNRLLRKLSGLLEEYSVRVGQQAVVLCVDHQQQLQVFGSQPLEAVVKRVKSEVGTELVRKIEGQMGGGGQKVGERMILPPLTMDGKPVSLNKMTQAHLRFFVPEMLKHSNVKGKPGWGKDECKPVWWPVDVPWCNVRSDCRSLAHKKTLSWTKALRKIVRCCYRHHNCLHLLHEYEENSDLSCKDAITQDNSNNGTSNNGNSYSPNINPTTINSINHRLLSTNDVSTSGISTNDASTSGISTNNASSNGISTYIVSNNDSKVFSDEQKYYYVSEMGEEVTME